MAVSQRDVTSYYDHIAPDKDNILRDVTSFYLEQIEDKFPIDNYTFDVIRRGKDLLELVDFNPLGKPTDGLLYDLDQIIETNFNESDEVDFRHISEAAGIQPNGMRQYGMPKDMVDLATGSDPDKLIDFLKLQESQQRNEEDRS